MDKYRIVIADDHEIFREGLKSLVEKDTRMRIVGEAKDGEELLETLKKVRCDVVVVDLSMPNLDGMSAIKVIKTKYSWIKILVLTMQKDHEHFKHAMTHGASGYLLKDDAYEQFIKAVCAICKGKEFVSPSVQTLLSERFIRALDDFEHPSLDILTKREQQVLKLVASGWPNKNIASKLKISIRTVETHRNNFSNKLGIKNTASLVKYAISKGLV